MKGVSMAKKKRPNRRRDHGSIIDSIKTLAVQGRLLYEKIDPVLKRTKPGTKTQKPKGRKNDNNQTSDQ